MSKRIKTADERVALRALPMSTEFMSDSMWRVVSSLADRGIVRLVQLYNRSGQVVGTRAEVV